MAEVAQALYLVSTAAFAIIAGVVSIRLVWVSLRNGQSAERLLGLGLLGTAVLGYALMMIGLIGRQSVEPGGSIRIYLALTTAGWIFHNLGLMCMLRFIVQVFHPKDTWAKVVAAVMSAVLWGGWLGYVAQGGMQDGLPRSAYWVTFAVIGTYPVWMAVESIRYWLLMRRRLSLGLADPLVTDRFRLWGMASTFAAASIWTVNIPGLLGLATVAGEGADLVAICLFFTGLFGIGTVSIYWLTFFPPRWYRRRLEVTG